MQRISRLAVATVTAVTLALLAGLASAQSPIKQMKLTEKQVDSFIAAHKEVAAVVSKMQPDKVDPAIEKELEMIAKKFGFKDFDEYDDVAANLALVLTGIDPQTKAFTDPPTAIKKQIDETTADKSLSDKERKQFLDDLADALKMAQPIMHPSNIELVKKYYDKLEPLLQ